MLFGGRLCQCGCGPAQYGEHICLHGLRLHLSANGGRTCLCGGCTCQNAGRPYHCFEHTLVCKEDAMLLWRTHTVLYSVRLSLQYMENAPISMHCKQPIPKIRNKYSQKRNCAATGTISTFSVSGLYIPTIDLPILLQEISGVWTDPEYM
jgi:hypothetical protein